jgi:hypothetical protein
VGPRTDLCPPDYAIWAGEDYAGLGYQLGRRLSGMSSENRCSLSAQEYHLLLDRLPWSREQRACDLTLGLSGPILTEPDRWGLTTTPQHEELVRNLILEVE